MKITPMPGGSGQPGTVLTTTEPAADPSSSAMSEKRRVLKMKVNRTPDFTPPSQEGESAPEPTQPAISDTSEAQADEATKPLSPQFAALARQRRELQLARQAFESERKAFEAQKQSGSSEDYLAKLKAQPLSVLQEAGVLDSPEFYDELTARIMGQQGQSESLAKIRALEAKLESFEKGVETKLTEREQQAEKQALDQIRRDVDLLSAKDDAFELVRTTKSQSDVLDLIHRTWKKTGEVMDIHEALTLVEQDLMDQLTEVAKTKKLQGKLQPQASQQAPQRTMTTLTNQHGTSPATMDRRQRAIAAMMGSLKR